ncbi:60S ribosomal protein L39 [Striga asiatica]|uniref:60S ribosomal protein L39 n=2 Tax=Lamiales TaxID=4143 RepID=A0A5A7QW61_STRAF|nr:60S ribosomal protein L39 [Striga asiatica]
MALPMAAIAKLGIIAAAHGGLTPAAAALLWPFLFKFSFSFRPLRGGCTDLFHAMGLFFFQVGHIVLGREPSVGPTGGLRWRRAVRFVYERVIHGRPTAAGEESLVAGLQPMITCYVSNKNRVQSSCEKPETNSGVLHQAQSTKIRQPTYGNRDHNPRPENFSPGVTAVRVQRPSNHMMSSLVVFTNPRNCLAIVYQPSASNRNPRIQPPRRQSSLEMELRRMMEGSSKRGVSLSCAIRLCSNSSRGPQRAEATSWVGRAKGMRRSKGAAAQKKTRRRRKKSLVLKMVEIAECAAPRGVAAPQTLDEQSSRRRRNSTMPSHKTFMIKKKLAKKQRQNRPIPYWIRLRTDNTIRYNAKRRHWRRTKLGF